jgi:hypothetical protein
MKKNTLILLVIIVAVLGTYLLLKKDTNSTIRRDLVDFGIENTDNITKIRITKKDEAGAVILEKKAEDYWMLNDTWDANIDNVALMLKTLNKMEVKSPVAKAGENVVLNYMAVSGKKIEIFEGNNLLKTIYFGTTSTDDLGTYAMLEGAKAPYVLHIPGFQGYLNTRFSHVKQDWRSKIIYSIESEEINRASVKWTEKPEQSFTIINKEEDPFIQDNTGKKASNKEVNLNKIRSYLNHFEMVPFTVFAQNVTQGIADSISKTNPFCVVEVEDKKGALKIVRIFYKPLEKNTYNKFDDDGNPLDHEVEKYYAFIDQSTEILIIQDATFSKLMKIFTDFSL